VIFFIWISGFSLKIRYPKNKNKTLKDQKRVRPSLTECHLQITLLHSEKLMQKNKESFFFFSEKPTANIHHITSIINRFVTKIMFEKNALPETVDATHGSVFCFVCRYRLIDLSVFRLSRSLPLGTRSEDDLAPVESFSPSNSLVLPPPAVGEESLNNC
jgi:hypothetical protein